MSGIFRSFSQNSPAESTPHNKRYSLSAFCTSPGTLQDVTMDNSYGTGYRSPCVSMQPQYPHQSGNGAGGPTSPLVLGRSVREIEEQMATLRKENFNLKLRLYFMEETIPSYQHQQAAAATAAVAAGASPSEAAAAAGRETLMKQLIDAKVEMELLRKEIDEKKDILKEAAQAMDQMERIQKETETKGQVQCDELRQKLQYYEMERDDMEKSQRNCMSDLLGHANLSENMDAVQKIRELEGVIKQADGRLGDMQKQINNLNHLLCTRDETIKEYEEKVKELVFQNSELIESLEIKEKENVGMERLCRDLRLANKDLKEENEQLSEELDSVRQNYRNEVVQMRACERQMRDQQHALDKMQSTITSKSTTTARLLERLQEYDKMVTKINFERNLAKRENRFFRAIIAKLRAHGIGGGGGAAVQTTGATYTIAKEIYTQYDSSGAAPSNLSNARRHHSQCQNGGQQHQQQQRGGHCENNVDNDIGERQQQLLSMMPRSDRGAVGENTRASVLEQLSARGDYQHEFKLRQKFCVNFSRQAAAAAAAAAQFVAPNVGDDDELLLSTAEDEHSERRHMADYFRNYSFNCGCELQLNGDGIDDFDGYEPEIPIRYTISDASFLCGSTGAAAQLSKSNSYSSLHANVSTTSILTLAQQPRCDYVIGQQVELLHQKQKLQHLRDELHERKMKLADTACMLQEAEEKLAERTQRHEQACRTIQKLMLNIKSQQDEIKRLQSTNDNQHTNSAAQPSAEQEEGAQLKATADGSSGVLYRSFSDTAVLPELSGAQQHKYELVVRQQEATIQALRAENKKKTSNLQNLVNHELWEKNREIERLTKLLNAPTTTTAPGSSPSSAACQQSPPSVPGPAHELPHAFSDAEYARALERNKLLQRKLNILMQRLRVEHNSERVAGQLRDELCAARADTERAEKWRHECADVCAVLSNRLEELAGFLNTLLRHKDVLGALAADRRRAMRHAVDRSLDLSKSLNRTLSISGVGVNGSQLAQLSDLSLLLLGGETDDVVGEQAEEQPLAAQHRTFNSHEELAQQRQPGQQPPETGRSATKRDKKERRSLPLPAAAVPDASESEWSEPDRKVSLARIGLAEERRAHRHGTAGGQLDASVAPSDSESDAPPLTTTTSAQLEQLIAQRDEHIRRLGAKLAEADGRLSREQLRANDAAGEVERLRQRNEQLHTDLLELQAADERDRAHALAALTEERDRLAIEARLAERRIDALQDDHERLQTQHAAALALAADGEAQRLQQWQAQLLELQRQYAEAQRTIDGLGESEEELRRTLLQSELDARALRKQLDESTLQSSKAVLERTNAFNEKLRLEQRVAELVAQLAGYQSPGYTSDEQRLQLCAGAVPASTSADAARRKNASSSSDLGIESDLAARHCSVELAQAQRLQLQTIELNTKPGVILPAEDDNERAPCLNVTEQENINPLHQAAVGSATAAPVHDCAKVEQENVELRRKLIRTKRTLVDTYQNLRVANERKAQVEKDIKNQILKTHNVLKNVRSNMENTPH